jgi:hypothetical protein
MSLVTSLPLRYNNNRVEERAGNRQSGGRNVDKSMGKPPHYMFRHDVPNRTMSETIPLPSVNHKQYFVLLEEMHAAYSRRKVVHPK